MPKDRDPECDLPRVRKLLADTRAALELMNAEERSSEQYLRRVIAVVKLQVMETIADDIHQTLVPWTL